MRLLAEALKPSKESPEVVAAKVDRGDLGAYHLPNSDETGNGREPFRSDSVNDPKLVVAGLPVCRQEP